MNRILSLALGGAAAALFSVSAGAQMGPGGPGMMSGPSAKPAVDCSKARDPQRCEARQKASEACVGQRGAAHRQCMEDHMPPPDCSKTRYPARCEAMVAAREACKDKVGPDRRQCMEDHMPPPDCSKTRNPARCEAMVAAREVCKDKVGPDRQQCMRDQMTPASPPPAKK